MFYIILYCGFWEPYTILKIYYTAVGGELIKPDFFFMRIFFLKPFDVVYT